MISEEGQSTLVTSEAIGTSYESTRRRRGSDGPFQLSKRRIDPGSDVITR